MAIPLRPGDEEPEPGTDSWWPADLSLLGERPPLEPTLGDLGIVYPGKRHVFSGPQESAKTLAAYAVGISVIRQGHTICLIDFEMGPWDARNRLRELGVTQEELGAIRYVEPNEPANDERIDVLVELAPELVIIDAAAGAYDIQSLDENKRADVERWARLYVGRFWRAGIASIVLDHVVKNTETRGSYAIGSERKVGGADVHLGFEVINPVKRGSTGLYKIVTHKDRGGYLKRGKLAELELVSDPDTHQITWAFRPTPEGENGDTFRPTHIMEEVSRYLEGQSESVTRNEVERSIPRKAPWIRASLDILISEGFLEESRHRSKHLVRSIQPYRELEDKTEVPEDDGIPF